MLRKNLHTTILTGLASVFLGAGVLNADTLSVVTSASAQKATDSINWASVGGDQQLLTAGGSVKTVKGATAQVALSAANSMLSRVCSASPCSWTGAGFTSGDTLLWTSDAGNGGNGPMKLTFSSGIAGAGALVQADGPGPFTAKIEAFNGSTSLGAFTVASGSSGLPVYIGVLDQSGPHVTSVVFSMAAVHAGLTTDFAIDTVELAATASAPAVQFSPTSLSFPVQLLKTKSAVKTITLRNSGMASLTVTHIATTGDFAQTNNCATLAVNATCTINVTFTPSAVGTRTGTVAVTDNASGSPQKVNLTGIGTEVKLSTTKLTFPATTVGKVSSPQNVTVSNIGSTALSITSISLTGTNPGDFKYAKTCGASLAAGSSCTVSVAFQPKAKGARSAGLSIADNGGASPQNVALGGTGQ
jgi:hypothetical protein